MRITKEKTASFDVDAQKTFTPLCPNELPVAGGEEIVDELNQQAAYARLRIGSKDAHSPQAIWVANELHPCLSPLKGENVDVHWNLHAVPGTTGFELLDGLPRPKDYNYFVWKGIELDMHPYGACYHDFAEQLSTGVIDYLQVNNIDTVIVGGLALDYCVKKTILQLRHSDFTVILNLAATRGIAKASIDATLEEMRQHHVLLIESASELSL